MDERRSGKVGPDPTEESRRRGREGGGSRATGELFLSVSLSFISSRVVFHGDGERERAGSREFSKETTLER